jgi:transposase InsO family protein
MRTKLVEDALHMAFDRRRPPRGVIFHSDRGSQYTSRDFAALARANGVTLSLGATGCAYDNAVAESFFATIKRELITTRAWRSVTELRRADFNYIEAGTTPAASIAPFLTSAPPSGKLPTVSPSPRRHNRLNQPVRRTGSTPEEYSPGCHGSGCGGLPRSGRSPEATLDATFTGDWRRQAH